MISEFGESHSGLLASERNELEPRVSSSLFFISPSRFLPFRSSGAEGCRGTERAGDRVSPSRGKFGELRKLRGVLYSLGRWRKTRRTCAPASRFLHTWIRASQRLVNVHVVKRFDNTLHLRPSERTELDLDQPLETAKRYPFRAFHYLDRIVEKGEEKMKLRAGI